MCGLIKKKIVRSFTRASNEFITIEMRLLKRSGKSTSSSDVGGFPTYILLYK